MAIKAENLLPFLLRKHKRGESGYGCGGCLAYLQSLHATVGKSVLQPFGELEAFVRQVAVKRQCDAEHSSDDIESHEDTKCTP